MLEVWSFSINKGNIFGKKQKFSTPLQSFFLFSVSVNCIVLDWFITKIILILQKFVLRLLEMVANQGSRLEQSYVIKFLVAKCKPCEIYTIFDVCWEARFCQKNWLNVSLPLQTWVEKKIHNMETHWLSSKESSGHSNQ